MNDSGDAPAGARQGRLLSTLQQLLAIGEPEVRPALDRASSLIAEALAADKVDVFLYDPTISSLFANGTSDTPMGRRQHELGLERLPIANGGLAVRTYLSGQTCLSGATDSDPEELLGIKQGLGVRSSLLVPLDVNGERRGVLSVVSAEPDHFDHADLEFVQSVAGWIGVITHRTLLVEQMRREAEEEVRRRAADELIAILAHDLRAPLTPLFGWVEMLRSMAERDGQDQYLRAVAAISRGLDRVRHLTLDLLDASRLDQGIFASDPTLVDLVALARQAVAIVGISDADIVMRGAASLKVIADASRMQQALENLLSNARRHSPAGVPIELDARAEARADGTYALLTVRDRGPGIAPDLLPRLFTRFASGPGSGGLGLGLYLARAIVGAHEGTLTVESTPGQGAAFHLALPLVDVEPAFGAAPSGGDQSA